LPAYTVYIHVEYHFEICDLDENTFLSRNLDQNMLRNNTLILEKSYRRTQSWCAQALGAHHHTL